MPFLDEAIVDEPRPEPNWSTLTAPVYRQPVIQQAAEVVPRTERRRLEIVRDHRGSLSEIKEGPSRPEQAVVHRGPDNRAVMVSVKGRVLKVMRDENALFVGLEEI